MSGRLADLSQRIEGMRKLDSVVRAMRDIAAVRSRQATTQLAAADDYAATLRAALSGLLGLLSGPVPEPDPRSRILVVFLAERGFVGAFSERLLDRLPGDAERVFVVGTRGQALARERGVAAWGTMAMPARPEAVSRFADAAAQRLLAGAPSRVDALYAAPCDGGAWTCEERRLYPFVAGVPPARSAPPPLLNLPPGVLLPELLAEGLHAELCRATLHAMAAEDTARMTAMSAAGSEIAKRLDRFERAARAARQEAVTAEISELSAGARTARNRRTAPGTLVASEDPSRKPGNAAIP